jgi:uncharacterized protein
MLFIVRFTDKPDCLSVRQDHMQSHLEWLESNRHAVLRAGSLRVEPDAAPIGAHWIVEAANRDAVEQLLRSDPFWIQGLRQSVEILHWSTAFPERKVLI